MLNLLLSPQIQLPWRSLQHPLPQPFARKPPVLRLPLAPKSRSIGVSRPGHVAATRSMKDRCLRFRKSRRMMSLRQPLRPSVPSSSTATAHSTTATAPSSTDTAPSEPEITVNPPQGEKTFLLPPRTPLTPANTVLTCLGHPTTQNSLSDLASNPIRTTNTFHRLVREGLPLPIPNTQGNTGPCQVIARDTPRDGSGADF